MTGYPHLHLATPGIVRNLLKEPFYLRIPKDRRGKRPGKTVIIPSNLDVNLEYHDFDSIVDQLIKLDRLNILRIIQYPNSLANTAVPGGMEIVYLPSPPVETNVFWVSTITNDMYVFDLTLNRWRSTNPEVIPFIRNFSNGTPAYPYGAESGYPVYVNNTADRTYLLYRMFCYVTDRTNSTAMHQFRIVSPLYADEIFSIQNGTGMTFTPAVQRLIMPTQTLEIRHEPDVQLYYVSITTELSEVI